MSSPDHPSLLPALLRQTLESDVGSERVRRSARDWVVDVAAFLLAAGFGLLAAIPMIDGGDPTSDTMMVIDLSVGALSCLAIWVRRRWPVGVAVVTALVSTFFIASAGASMVALFTVAVHRPVRVLMWVLLLNVVTFPPSLYIHWTDEDTIAGTAIPAAIAFAAVTAWGMFVRARRQLVLSLADRVDRAEAEQKLRVEQARSLERERIAREMHDVLAHRISLLSLHAGALEFRPDAPPDEIAHAAGVIRDSAHQALQDLREVIQVLREDERDADRHRPQPTLGELDALLEESRAAGMQVTVTNELADPAGVPVAVGRNAYRIVQEGLTNARKHARGEPVWLTLRSANGLTIEVRNGLPTGESPGFEIPGARRGLIGLSERTQLAGGQLEHGRTPDGEFRLWARLPLST